MTEKEFLKKMQDEVLDTENEVTMDTELATVEEWDSLSFVGFLAMARVATGRKLERATVQKAKALRDLYALLA